MTLPFRESIPVKKAPRITLTMDKATSSYSSQQAAIDSVDIQIQKAYQYDVGRPLNKITLDMWNVLLTSNPAHPEHGLWPRFLDKWRRDGRVTEKYLANKKEVIADALDRIIALESGKAKR